MMFASCTCRRGLGYFNSFICFFCYNGNSRTSFFGSGIGMYGQNEFSVITTILQVWNTPTLITDRPSSRIACNRYFYNTSFRINIIKCRLGNF